MVEKKRKKVKNAIRDLSEKLTKQNNYSDYIRGNAYTFIHSIIITSIGFIGIFSSSLFYLSCLLIIVSLDAVSIVMLHECPLTLLEKKYLGVSSCDNRNHILKQAGIMYKCGHNYEKQIELLINTWCIIACKLLIIMVFKTFHIKLNDDGDIYCK